MRRIEPISSAVKDYYSGMSSRKVGIKYGIHPNTVRKWVTQRDTNKLPNAPKPISIREMAIKDYVSGMSYRNVGDKYNTDHKTILGWVKHLGSGRTKEESNRLQGLAKKGIRYSPATEFSKGFTPWNKGKECPEMRGSNHPNWRGGQRKYPFTWKEAFREAIRNRDGRKCQVCGVPEIECNSKLEVHHIDYDKTNMREDNLISLCKRCHARTGIKNRNYWQERFHAHR